MASELDQLSSRVGQLEQLIGLTRSPREGVSSLDVMRNDVRDLHRQVQQLQGTGGLLEPLSMISGYKADSTVPSGYSFVTQAAYLAAGNGITFSHPLNLPYLRIDVSGAFANYDYVVASDGTGTHLTLFGASGALEAAIATGANRVIWVCTTHVETRTTTHSISAFATGQRITVASGSPYRAQITFNFTGPAITQAVNNAGSGYRLRFENIDFLAGVGQTVDFYQPQGGFQQTELELNGVDFGGSGTWRYLLIGGAGGTAWSNNYFRRLRGTMTALINGAGASNPTGPFVFHDSDMTLTNIVTRNGASEDDVATSIEVTNNRLTITGYGIRISHSDRRFKFTDNTIYHNQTAAIELIRYGDAGGGGFGAISDCTVTGNWYKGQDGGGNATKFFWQSSSGGGGTAKGIVVAGNSLLGPGGTATAIQFDNATLGCSAAANGFDNWGTNVGGTGAPGTGGDHHLLSNLTAFDDHTQYLFLAGRTGGQIANGGTAAGENLTLVSTANATKGSILFGTSAYDEVNNRLGLTTAVPTVRLDLGTSAGAALLPNGSPSGGSALWFRATAGAGGGADAAIYQDATNQLNIRMGQGNVLLFKNTVSANGAVIAQMNNLGNFAWGGYGFVGSTTLTASNTTAGDMTATRTITGANVAIPAGGWKAFYPLDSAAMLFKLQTGAAAAAMVQMQTSAAAVIGTWWNDGSMTLAAATQTGIGTGQVLFSDATVTDTSASTKVYVGVTPTISVGANNVTAEYRLLNMLMTTTGADSGNLSNATGLQGMRFDFRHRSSGTVTRFVGIEVFSGPDGATAVANGTITTIDSLELGYVARNGTTSTTGTWRGLLIDNAILGAGPAVLTNQIGIDISALTGSTLSIGLRNAASTVFTPSATQTLVAATTILANATFIAITAAAPTTLTANPLIAAGQNGQILTILNVGANAITFNTNNIHFGTGGTPTLNQDGDITLIYSSARTIWEEVARSDSGGGGGGGASTADAFVTIGHPADLTAERNLAAGAGISVTDGGANNDVTLGWLPAIGWALNTAGGFL